MQQDKAQLIDELVEFQRGFSRFTDSGRTPPVLRLNLTMQQLKILSLLNAQDSRSSQELTAALGVSPATTSGIIDRLVAQGMVRRREDPDDRRVRRIELSEQGRKLMDDLVESSSAYFRQLLSGLEVEELRALGKILRKMRHLAQSMGPSTPCVQDPTGNAAD
ncbi:MarR family winged helix-turn-helix transcriptional regulator [Kribbella sp. CA-245084]|uniref:MarR family winged helix-turn-helix transcriptional regulator n=1 Tax=Kribbella sp. CA-245084 TaxID=3239940 RepID=UPI003D8E0D46